MDTCDKTKLVSFQTLPYGARFKYPKSDKIWTVLWKKQHRAGELLEGTIAEWRPDMLSYGKWTGQSILAHLPEENGGDCPDMVIGID